MPIAFIQSRHGYGGRSRVLLMIDLWCQAPDEPGRVAGDDDGGRDGGRHDRSRDHHRRWTDVGEDDGRLAEPGIFPDINRLHGAQARRRPASLRVERMERAAADDAAARADERAAPEVARAEHGVRTDVDVFVDPRRAVREDRAEPDEEALAAGL